MIGGGIPGAMIRLSSGGTRLGRAADNTLQLPDVSISRYHAFLGVDEEGQVRLSDLGSTNGTFINEKRIPDHTPIRIDDGDRLQFGANVVFKFIRPDPCDEQFQREMFERTVRDSLTGLYNRAYFLAQFGALADRSGLKGLGVAVLMLDIDHFKRINDQHGHEVGDAVLREVANVLRQATRSDDLVARYGGEEFVIALPVAAPDGATERAERMRTDARLEADARRRDTAPGHGEHRPGVHAGGPPPVGRLAAGHRRPRAVSGQELGQGPDRLQPRGRPSLHRVVVHGGKRDLTASWSTTPRSRGV